mmetsp:Transcript_12156/g.38854  ORF Transcript_12156/g.38854 Transcript_12156/m.38854 type:complete len:463 (+) Transcript_12156:569-1957(+)
MTITVGGVANTGSSWAVVAAVEVVVVVVLLLLLLRSRRLGRCSHPRRRRRRRWGTAGKRGGDRTVQVRVAAAVEAHLQQLRSVPHRRSFGQHVQRVNAHTFDEPEFAQLLEVVEKEPVRNPEHVDVELDELRVVPRPLCPPAVQKRARRRHGPRARRAAVQRRRRQPRRGFQVAGVEVLEQRVEGGKLLVRDDDAALLGLLEPRAVAKVKHPREALARQREDHAVSADGAALHLERDVRELVRVKVVPELALEANQRRRLLAHLHLRLAVGVERDHVVEIPVLVRAPEYHDPPPDERGGVAGALGRAAAGDQQVGLLPARVEDRIGVGARLEVEVRLRVQSNGVGKRTRPRRIGRCVVLAPCVQALAPLPVALRRAALVAAATFPTTTADATVAGVAAKAHRLVPALASCDEPAIRFRVKHLEVVETRRLGPRAAEEEQAGAHSGEAHACSRGRRVPVHYRL